jgi:DNA-binding NarL/FixJ family response regulator
MDLQMPKMHRVEATLNIREEPPNAKIIALITYSGDIQASRALKAGAVGYILKNLLRTDLIDTIRGSTLPRTSALQ